MRRTIVLLFLLLMTTTAMLAAKPTITVNRLLNKQMEFNEPIDYHITSSEVPLEQSSISINHEDAWIFFDNIRPQTVINKHLSSIKINGASVSNNVNARVTMYKHGTVIIPHKSSYKPLTVYSGKTSPAKACPTVLVILKHWLWTTTSALLSSNVVTWPPWPTTLTVQATAAPLWPRMPMRCLPWLQTPYTAASLPSGSSNGNMFPKKAGVPPTATLTGRQAW